MLNTITPQQVDNRMTEIRQTKPYKGEFEKHVRYEWNAHSDIYHEARDGKNTAVINNLMLEQVLKNQEQIIANQEKLLKSQGQIGCALDIEV